MQKEMSYIWHCQAKAESFIAKTIEEAKEKNSLLARLQEDLFEKTSTNLFDFIDHIELGYSEALHKELAEIGFAQEVATPSYRVFQHPDAKLPLVVVKDQTHPFVSIAVTVEHIADFLMVRGMSAWIEGAPLSGYRRACVSKEQGVFVYVVERRGVLSIEPQVYHNGDLNAIMASYEKWQTRPRIFDDPDQENEGMVHALGLAEELVETVGVNMSAYIVLDVERRYWQAKNRAGQIQKNRQDALGMGWANHDHHTFRSSRKHFRNLVRLFEILGFSCRERFYAGKEAGWGAQIMEHKADRLVVFLDVDLLPDEVAIDFSHLVLPESKTHGTVGLWCALHGESILQAGMHHLEAQFAFDKLEHDLQSFDVALMPAFTNLAYLRQAFTEGQMWPVAHKRLQRLLEAGAITHEQAERFRQHGALGSHLENLERKEGYKGFYQKGVSDIISRTDPRKV